MPEKLQKPVFKIQINLKHEWNYAAILFINVESFHYRKTVSKK